MAGVKFDIEGDESGFVGAARRAENAAKNMSESVTNEGKALDDMFKKIAGGMATMAAGLSATALTKKIFDIRSEFQQLEVAFSTMLKSEEKANKLMRDATEFAATTPFDLKGVAAGIKQNLAYGASVDTVIDEMRMLGDVAAGVSMPLNDLVYLYGTLRTSGRVATIDIRQFAGRGIPIYEELAKVLGVAKNEVAGLVTAGKVGFADIEKAFKNMTSAGGMFNNLMANQSKTLQGQYSNLKDNIEMMFNEIGQQTQGVFGDAISLAGKLVENYKEVGRALSVLVAAYGTYKAGLIAVAAVEKVQATAKAVKHFLELTKTMKMATAAQTAFNAAALANPYVLAAAALATLVAGVVAFTKHKKAEVEAQKEASREVAKEVSEVNTLVAKLKDANTKEDERVKALERLKEIAPDVVEGIDTEAESLDNLNTQLEEYNSLKQLEIALKVSTEYVDFQDSIQSLNDAKTKMQEKQAEMINLWTDLSGKITDAIGSGKVSDGMSKWLESFMYDPALDMNEKLDKVLKRYNDMMFSRRMGYDYNKGDFNFLQSIARESGGATGFYEKTSKELVVAETEYTNAVENLRKRIHAYIALVYTDAEEAKKAEETLLVALGLEKAKTTGGGDGSDEKALTEKQKEEAYKRQQAEKKAAENLAKMKRDLNAKVAKADIDSMEDGYVKTMATLKYNLQQEQNAIEEQKKALLKSKRDEALKSWLAEDPEGKKEYQFVYTAELTPEEEAVFAAMGVQAQKEFNKGRDKANKQYVNEAAFTMRQFEIDAMEHGSSKDNAQRQLDNEKELHSLEMQREAYIEAAKAAHILAEQKKIAADPKYMMKMFDESQANADFDKIVKDTENRQKKDEAEELLRKYEDYASGVARIEKELNDDLSRMRDENGNFIAGFSQENVDIAVRRAEEAKDALAVGFAEQSQDFQVFVRTLGEKTIKELEVMLQQAEQELNSLESLEGSSEELARARAEVKKLKDELKKLKVDKGVKDSSVNWSDLNGVLSDAADNFSELGSLIPGVAGKMLSGIGSIAAGAIGIANGITAIGKAATAAEKASAVLAVVSAAIQIVQFFTSAIEDNKKANEDAANAAREYARSLAELDAQERRDKYDNIFGENDYGKFIENVSLAKEQVIALQEELKKGAGWDIKDQEDFESQTSNWAIFSKRFRDTVFHMYDNMDDILVSDLRSGWQKFWGSGNDNLNVAHLSDFIDDDGMIDNKRLRDWYEAYGEGLSDEQKNIVEDLLAGWDSYYETLEQMEGYVEGLFGNTIDNIADKWIDAFDRTGSAITDLSEISNDFAKSFAKDMLKNILATEIFNDANTQALLDMLKSGDMEGATKFYKTLVEQAEALGSRATEVIQTTGVTSESTREATSKGIAQASQSSVDELNGRATAIQSHTFSINQNLASVVSISSQILTKVGSIEAYVSKLNDMDNKLMLMRSDMSDMAIKGIRLKG